jgi:hypothetical protein
MVRKPNTPNPDSNSTSSPTPAQQIKPIKHTKSSLPTPKSNTTAQPQQQLTLCIQPSDTPPAIEFDMWTAQSKYHRIKHGQKAKSTKHQIKLNIKPNPCATNQTDQTQEILLIHTKIKHKQQAPDNNNLPSASSQVTRPPPLSLTFGPHNPNNTKSNMVRKPNKQNNNSNSTSSPTPAQQIKPIKHTKSSSPTPKASTTTAPPQHKLTICIQPSDTPPAIEFDMWTAHSK